MTQLTTIMIAALCLVLVGALQATAAISANGRIPSWIKAGQVAQFVGMVPVALWMVAEADLVDATWREYSVLGLSVMHLVGMSGTLLHWMASWRKK